jgi:putative inorganic carbon (HCO3(-)) transporter
VSTIVQKMQHSSNSQRGALMAALFFASVALGWTACMAGWKPFVLAAAIILFAVALLRWTFAFWMAMVALVGFSVETAIGSGYEMTLPTEALIPALTAAALVHILARGGFKWFHSPLNAAAGAYVLVMVLTLTVSSDRVVSTKAIVRDSGYIIAGFLLARAFLTTRTRLKALLAIGAVAVTVLMGYGFYTQFAAGVAIYQDIAQPFFKNHCIYAAYLAMAFAMLSAFVTGYAKTGWRTWGLALLGLWAFAITMTFVRGAWISLAALGVYYAWLYRRQMDLKLFVFGTVAVFTGVVIAGWLELAPLFAERLGHLTDPGYITNYDRIDRWMAALLMFRDHPWLGAGWGRYADEYYRYIYFTDTYSTQIRMGAHNLYLHLLAESGLAGAAAYTFFLGCFFRQVSRLRKRCGDLFLRTVLTGVAGAMLTYLVHGMVNNLGPSDKIELSFWLMPGLVVVINRMMHNSAEAGGKTENARIDHR